MGNNNRRLTSYQLIKEIREDLNFTKIKLDLFIRYGIGSSNDELLNDDKTYDWFNYLHWRKERMNRETGKSEVIAWDFQKREEDDEK